MMISHILTVASCRKIPVQDCWTVQWTKLFFFQMPHRTPSGRTLLRTGSRILEWNNHRAGEYAKARYGPFLGPLLVYFAEATVERMVRLEQNIINGQDEDSMAFKTSLASELSMVAVAVRLWWNFHRIVLDEVQLILRIRALYWRKSRLPPFPFLTSQAYTGSHGDSSFAA